MNLIVDFFAGYISWNTLAWVIIATATILTARLTTRFVSCNLHETGALIHGVAAMIAGISLVIHFMAGGIEANMEPTKWIDHFVAQFTPQSILINGVVAFVHFYLQPRRIGEQDAETQD